MSDSRTLGIVVPAEDVRRLTTAYMASYIGSTSSDSGSVALGVRIGKILGFTADGGQRVIQRLMRDRKPTIPSAHAEAICITLNELSVFQQLIHLPSSTPAALEMVDTHLAEHPDTTVDRNALAYALLRFSDGFLAELTEPTIPARKSAKEALRQPSRRRRRQPEQVAA